MYGEISDLFIRARCSEIDTATRDTDTHVHIIGSPSDALKKGYGLTEWQNCAGAVIAPGDGRLLRRDREDSEIIEAAIETVIKKRKDIAYRKYTRPDSLTLFLVAKKDEAITELDMPAIERDEVQHDHQEDVQPTPKKAKKTTTDIVGENAKVL